ncbi:hypothetical protein CYMTET_6586 [Cymbomonas tetramitiformis]|uniref:Uncharacterized protein n=1 Tax=Cymbomonas tetramitiformis TaxID=36881 RepID=A0AAE0GWS4_9CHLO|nr:hypothetical protein CYMTET_6586 [Cymbomonas tetramitiformis]
MPPKDGPLHGEEDTATLLPISQEISTDEFHPSARIALETTEAGSVSNIDETSLDDADAGVRTDPEATENFERAHGNWTRAVENCLVEPNERRTRVARKTRRRSLFESLQFGRLPKYKPKSILLTEEILEQRKLANVRKHVRWQDPKKEGSYWRLYLGLFLLPAKCIYLRWLEQCTNVLVALLTYELWAFPVRLALASVALNNLQMYFDFGVDLLFGANMCVMTWHATTQQRESHPGNLRKSSKARLSSHQQDVKGKIYSVDRRDYLKVCHPPLLA